MILPDTNTNNAPDYIREFVAQPAENGVSELLSNGNWCGHGEKSYRIYDIIENGNTIFKIQLPDKDSEELFPPAVRVTSTANQKQFHIYDPRQHPASLHAFAENVKKETKFSDIYRCEKCNGPDFKISVGFEVPQDSQSPNDTTWFATATECVKCGERAITFEDETA